MKYKIITATSAGNLATQVQQMLDEGWYPLGPPNYTDNSYWFQAVVWTDPNLAARVTYTPTIQGPF